MRKREKTILKEEKLLQEMRKSSDWASLADIDKASSSQTPAKHLDANNNVTVRESEQSKEPRDARDPTASSAKVDAVCSEESGEAGEQEAHDEEMALWEEEVLKVLTHG